MRRRLTAVGCAIAVVLASVVWAPGAAAAGCRPGSGIDLAGRTVSAEQLRNASLACANVRGARLDGLDLSQAGLVGADLTGASLARASLGQAHLDGAILAHADLAGADLGQADLTDADLTGADAENARLDQATLTGARLTGLDARSADFDQAVLAGADLTGVNLTDASLNQADMSRVLLDGADLTGADLTQVTDAGAVVRNTTGRYPVNALAGIVAALLLSFALIRWWRRPNPMGGRIVAAAVAVLAVAGIGTAVAGAWTWLRAPTWDGLPFGVLVAAFLFAVGALLVLTSVRRARGPLVAVALGLVGAAGEYLFCAAALASFVEITGTGAFVGACSGAECVGGLTRGWAGAGLGIALLVMVFVLARIPGVVRPGSGLRFDHVHRLPY